MKIIAIIERYKETAGWGLFRVEKGSLEDIKLKEFASICCDEMRYALDHQFIQFGEFDRSDLNKNTDLNICKPYFYPSGSFVKELAIHFCPFCAEKIEIELVEEDDGNIEV